MLDQTKQLPMGVGVGYKSKHFSNISEGEHPVKWLEIHAENYMGEKGAAGGRPMAQLRALSDRFPISVHGVGLSIGGEGRLDPDHLARLKHLIDEISPASFSEHLAWSTHDTGPHSGYFNDLLPLPYTAKTLARVCDHIDEVQSTLGRQMLLENPASYLAFAESTYGEVEFLRAVVKRTGCGLLLDVNNVFVSANNLRIDAYDYIDAFPHEAVGEIHLGGHDEDQDEDGAPLLIDSHGREVADPVWHLYTYALATAGPKPTLIEWDTDVPEWEVLASEAARAALRLEQVLV
ncbi:MNIO family bufferin maturase [Celeribacter naphthalenivorans]|uniref:MNIO family bufferin maturase n=1 Tax=Celeribacter naphthalenivorans TaxID=1614694 RepID=UPI001CFB98F7|nr:DUF692 domain-containing protein [Celeribacter naphthalenivorans]